MSNHPHIDHAPSSGVEQSISDPVCGMTVTPEQTVVSHVHEGMTHYFCSIHCLYRFKADPQAFLKQTSPQVAVGRNQ
ncbi:MAG: YHS domain-containing protein [Blastocatellales bacterium]|nr:YHS domain-containing protein [Nitrosomonas nitrosa]